MSMLNKISVIGIILLLAILFCYLYMQDLPPELPAVSNNLLQKIRNNLRKAGKGWRLYADGKCIFILESMDEGDSPSVSSGQRKIYSVGAGSGNTVRFKKLGPERLILSETKQHGILVRSESNTRCIRDMTGNPVTRIIVPFGTSRKMSVKGSRIEFQWFDEESSRFGRRG